MGAHRGLIDDKSIGACYAESWPDRSLNIPRSTVLHPSTDYTHTGYAGNLRL
ncbi:MAG TPA: hypothetical protein VLY63_15000 [Anaerolineae bacterium]|nr:hypothetical protein [Anaerolineae bacterium]